MKITMRNDAPGGLLKLSAMERTEATVGGRRIVYSLFDALTVSGRVYAVSACEMGYCELRTVGDDLENAYRLFRTVADGGVAPCTLNDVIDDISCVDE